jgi:hypothetical protein
MRHVDFRDGRRAVQDHVADFFESHNVRVLSHDEAMRLYNDDPMVRRLNKAQDDVVRQHFARFQKT